jgi:hypothetical protein
MRVRRYIHIVVMGRAHVINKNKWANHPAGTERQQAAYLEIANIAGAFFNNQVNIRHSSF